MENINERNTNKFSSKTSQKWLLFFLNRAHPAIKDQLKVSLSQNELKSEAFFSKFNSMLKMCASTHSHSLTPSRKTKYDTVFSELFPHSMCIWTSSIHNILPKQKLIYLTCFFYCKCLFWAITCQFKCVFLYILKWFE